MNNNTTQLSTYSSWNLIKDIFELLKPYKWRFLGASLIRLVGDLVWLYPAIAFASLVTFLTKYKTGDSLSPVWLLLGLWMLATIIRCLSQFFCKYLGYRLGEKLAIDSSLKTVEHMFKLDMVWHERESSGNKIKRVQNAGEGLNRIMRLWFECIIEIGVNLVVMNIILASFDYRVVFILLFFLVTFFLISRTLTRRAGEASYRVNAQEENVNGVLFEAVNNVRTVKAMSMAKTLFAILAKEMDSLFDKLRVRIFWYQSRSAVLTFWAVSFKVAIVAFIGWGILHGRYEIGFLILFNSYFSDLRASIDELAKASIEFVTAKFSVARMKDILNEPVTIDNDKGKTAFPSEWKKLSFKNVSFAYGQNKVLTDISFEVQRGEKVGIVGLSGAGKSTLFKLLLKEREEFDGSILFDDVSIKKIRKNDYFNQVAVVLQDTEVFNFSFRDNITITNNQQKRNSKLLKQAITTAHISNLVDKLPQGLETVVGEKGVRLSGGERQRLGIARAIFKEPEILLLDEATSHLDLESEEKIRDSLHKFFENVTAIVIAHRLSTIKEMDKILVIEDGKIIESGNFNTLYARNGRLRELWEKQKL